jgi:hypothetical protein
MATLMADVIGLIDTFRERQGDLKISLFLLILDISR